MVLRRDKRPQGIRENTMKLVNFNCKKSMSNVDVKLIKHLIKKIKGKRLG